MFDIERSALNVERWTLERFFFSRSSLFIARHFLKPEMLHIYRQITGLRRGPAVRHCAKARKCRPFSVRTTRHRRQTDDAFSAAILVPATSQQAMADFVGRSCDALTAILETDRRAAAPHFFWPHCGPSPAADSRMAESKHRFLSRRGRFGGHGKTGLSQGDERNARLPSSACSFAPNSLRRAVVDLGCDENKIDIVRTGIPLEEFPFRERHFPAKRRMAICSGLPLDREKRFGHDAARLHHFPCPLS